MTIENFDYEEIACGAYGTVYKGINRADETKTTYAIKELDIEFIEKNGKVNSVNRERDVLIALDGCR